MFQAIQGVVALFNDTYYVVGEKWTFAFDITTWGLDTPARGHPAGPGRVLPVPRRGVGPGVGVGVVAISAVLNFTWLPYYPLWSMLAVSPSNS